MRAIDTPTIAVATLVLASVALAAAIVPAWRAPSALRLDGRQGLGVA